jgi:hypothetical protein
VLLAGHRRSQAYFCTPPPLSSDEFAAFTITSTRSVAMPPVTVSIRIELPRPIAGHRRAAARSGTGTDRAGPWRRKSLAGGWR